jgi:hypothetical protein
MLVNPFLGSVSNYCIILTSSMKMMLGLLSRASWNRFFTSFSLSPNHFDTRSADDTEKNVELFASVATALAR